MKAASYALIVFFIVLTFGIWYLDRDIVRAEGGYDIRNLWHYPSTYLCMWSSSVLAWLLLWWVVS